MPVLPVSYMKKGKHSTMVSGTMVPWYCFTGRYDTIMIIVALQEFSRDPHPCGFFLGSSHFHCGASGTSGTGMPVHEKKALWYLVPGTV